MAETNITDPHGIVADLEAILSVTPDNLAVWLRLASLTGFAEGRGAEIDVLGRAIAAVGIDAALCLRRSVLLVSCGRIDEGLDQLDTALGTLPNDSRLIVERMKLAVQLDQHAAFDALEKRIVDHPDQAWILSRVAPLRADYGKDPAEAKAILDRSADQADPAISAAMARLALQQLNPVTARHHLLTARALRRRRGKPHKGGLALALLNEARVHAPSIATARKALIERDLDALLDAAREEPGSTVIAAAIVRHLRAQGLLAAAACDGATRIPRAVTQFWDRPAPPDDVATLMRTWEEATDGWAYRRFTMQTAAAWLDALGDSDLMRAWRYSRHPAQRADLFRLAILYHEGGVYIDADDRRLSSLTNLVGGAELVLAIEMHGTIANNFIAAAPRHPLIGRALADAVGASLEGGAETIWLRTGPGAMTRALVGGIADDRSMLDELSSGTIAVLTKPTLSRYLWMHCATDYKRQGGTWQDHDLRNAATT